MAPRKTFYIIDGSSYIYRAYHAIRELSTSKGFPTNAIYGFAQMLLKIIKDKSPDYLALAFDTSAPTFRHGAYADYKAHRPEMPDRLSVQIPYIRRLVEALDIPVVLADGYEADDLIGTLARKAESEGLQVVIVSGDKDMLQLVSPFVGVYDTMRDKVWGEHEVLERFGVEPSRVVEVMGLMGDEIDNIPGVSGVGEKTAKDLIQQFGTIEHLLAHVEEVKKKNVREALREQSENARLSRVLATIRTDCPVQFDPERFRSVPLNPEAWVGLCMELEFTSLLKQIPPALPRMQPGFLLIDTPEKSVRWLSEKAPVQEVAIEPVIVKEDPLHPRLIGVALALSSGEAAYFPTESPETLEGLRLLFGAEKIAKMGHGLKRVWVALDACGIPFRGIRFDLEVAAYLVNPGRHEGTLESICLEWFGKRLTGWDELLLLLGEKGAGVPRPDQIAPWACERAECLLLLRKKLAAALIEGELQDLFDRIEIPLVEILAKMERIGFKVDSSLLEQISEDLEGRLKESTEKIYVMAKGSFNINSPRQLAEVLFERLALPPVRKTKTGYSTDEEVLTQLAFQHPLPGEILAYRQVMKLKSTYVDTLPRMIDPEDGRLHTEFSQTVAATGRLSSREPNLQNIPVRGELGRRIRQAFVAQEGFILLSADYNQIELRVLAHLSEDERLIDSFRKGEDIHTRTASEIFNLPPEVVTAEMRRMAKTVNFGILYGMSSFGLASGLGVSLSEAKRYIDRYFSVYEGVRRFSEEALRRAREQGYVTTLFHRRRYIPELASPNAVQRSLGERLVLNTPIQGSAADLIKIAMIRADRFLQEGMLPGARMILQVHDELIFEVPEDLVEPAKESIRREMEAVADLKVPLSVGLKVGRNWGDIE